MHETTIEPRFSQLDLVEGHDSISLWTARSRARDLAVSYGETIALDPLCSNDGLASILETSGQGRLMDRLKTSADYFKARPMLAPYLSCVAALEILVELIH